MGKEEGSTDYYILKEPVKVEWTCPYCGEDNSDDYDDFIESDLWYRAESSFCGNCDREVALNGDCDCD